MLRRIPLLALVLAVGLIGAAHVWAEAGTPTLRVATAEDTGIVLRAEGVGLVPRELESSAACDDDSPRAAKIALLWSPADAPAPARAGAITGQRVDISKLPDGFVTGRFQTTGAVDAATRAMVVEAPEPGINYYWRVFTVTADGWVSSPVARFEVPVCPHDELEPGQATGLVLNPDGESR